MTGEDARRPRADGEGDGDDPTPPAGMVRVADAMRRARAAMTHPALLRWARQPRPPDREAPR
jgi:hypothetical protein